MKLTRRQFLPLAGGAVVAPCISRAALAQTYPSRPITIIAPFPAGGPADTLGRILAEGMRASLGRAVVIENVSGASGSVGTGRAARAAADGYTLGLGGWVTHVINGAVYPLQYDVLNDFDPVSLIAAQPLLIIARKTMPASNLQELIDWLKANPGEGLQGTVGRGGASRVAGVFFQRETGTRYQFVPYPGTGIRNLMAGRIDFMIDLATNSLPQVRAGTIKVYAVTAEKRLAAAPDIPTVAEAGLPKLQVTSWSALYAPRGAPKEVIATLNAAVVDALANPAVRTRLADLGQEIFPRELQTPEALSHFHKAEIEKWWPILKAAGIKAK